jgi:hypothetical protein
MDQAAWNERYAGPDLVWGAGPNCFVAEQLAALEPGRALDLGSADPGDTTAFAPLEPRLKLLADDLTWWADALSAARRLEQP